MTSFAKYRKVSFLLDFAGKGEKKKGTKKNKKVCLYFSLLSPRIINVVFKVAYSFSV